MNFESASEIEQKRHDLRLARQAYLEKVIISYKLFYYKIRKLA